MIYFHVQRLSGGFMLSFLVGVVGAVIFGIKMSLTSAFTFLAYLMLLSTYLNVLGKCHLHPLIVHYTHSPILTRHNGDNAPERKPTLVWSCGAMEDYPCSLDLAHSLQLYQRPRPHHLPLSRVRLPVIGPLSISQTLPRVDELAR